MKPYFENNTVKIFKDSENSFRCFMKGCSGLIYLTAEQVKGYTNAN